MTATAPLGSDEHTCHAKHCTTEVPPATFMCRLHWGLVPAPMREAIKTLYRPGQEVDKQPSGEYLAIAKAAIDAVAHKQSRRPRPATPAAPVTPPPVVREPLPVIKAAKPKASKARKPKAAKAVQLKAVQLTLF